MEGTLTFRMLSAFAGCRRNASLGRSAASAVGLVLLQLLAPATSGVLWKKEEGNVVRLRQAQALEPASQPAR